MLETLAIMRPVVLLVGLFIGFSIDLSRAMGRGKDGAYMSLMTRQNDLLESQRALQAEAVA